MTTVPVCPLTYETTTCPALSLLWALLEEIHSLSDKLDAMQQILKTEESKKEKASTTKRFPVSGMIIALQLEYPDKTWTSDDFAKEIGCTGAA